MWSFLVLVLFICFYNIDIKVTPELIEKAENHWLGFALRQFKFSLHPRIAQWLIDIILISNITIASLFMMPVSMLLQIQTLNFMAGQTTPERLKAAAISKHGTKSQAMKGKEYARFILLNYDENQNIFINRKAAQDFANHMEAINDENKSQKS